MEELNLSWGEAPRTAAENWPKGPDGMPENAAFLVDTFEADAQADMIVGMLRAYDIPAIKRYAKDGTLGKVVLGFSGYGVALYVPESMLEEARALLEPVDDSEELQ
ncbi:MAG: hypothetical protein E7425_00800 [Ruminococcaceae bacterium]|jgi:hypothetical protein|nr:hypothetical protein [Oscillospiraceae bacterium]